MPSQGLIVFFTAIAICNGADIKWKARVKTSDLSGAGTNAGVFIQIIGESGKSNNIELDSDRDNFEQNDLESFVFKADDVGKPSQLRVWHDNNGDTPGWHLTWIELEAVTGEYAGTFVFNCDCWIASDQVEHGTERILKLSTMNWVVRVTTSNEEYAGSNVYVWITITGEDDTTRQIELDSEGDDFERGQTGVYPIKTISIGKPTNIRVHTGHNDQWHLDKIVLQNMNGGEIYTFNCNCWMGQPGKTNNYISVSDS